MIAPTMTDAQAGLISAFEAVRRTSTAHTFALGALERAFDAEMAVLANNRRALRANREATIKELDDKLARGEAKLAEERAAVARDRADVEDEKARIRAATSPCNDVVKLNVGGVAFETARAVLTKVEDSMLGRMFGRYDAMQYSEDGRMFIDRDGERFRIILDFLRDLDTPRTQKTIRALSEAAQESMRKELVFFGLEHAVFGVRPWTDDATFRPGPEMCSARSYYAAVSAGGRAVFFGGVSVEGDNSNTTEVLDTKTMAFTDGPDLLTRRSGCAAVQIDADRILVLGGFDGACLNTTEIFHFSTLRLTPGPTMRTARNLCAAVALDARWVLVIGGSDDSESALASTEILNLDAMAFSPGPTIATPRSGCAVVALDEHRIMVVGGRHDQTVGGGRLNTTEVLDNRTMVFTPGPTMSSARSYCAAVPVDAQHVLIIGGRDATGKRLATTELFDIAAMAFEPGPTMKIGRRAFAATRLDTPGEPKILVIGGRGDDEEALRTTEMLAINRERISNTPRHHP